MKEEDVLEVLRTIIDPEIGVNVVDLGLVYSAEVSDSRIRVVMTMTTPACPMSSYLTEMARAALVKKLPEASSIEVELVWDPPWSPAMMSAAAKKQLGWQE